MNQKSYFKFTPAQETKEGKSRIERQYRNLYFFIFSTIKNFKKPITCKKDLDGIMGIGEKIMNKVKEIIDTGTLEKIQVLKNDSQVKSLGDLTRV